MRAWAAIALLCLCACGRYGPPIRSTAMAPAAPAAAPEAGDPNAPCAPESTP